MNTRLLPFVFIFAFTCLSSPAGEPVQNPFGYTRLTKGEKVTFDQLDKKYLGRQCTVYMKPGFPKSFMGGVLPPGALINDKDTKRHIWIGEFYALEAKGIRLRWYYEKNRTAFTEYGAAGDEIDCIIFK